MASYVLLAFLYACFLVATGAVFLYVAYRQGARWMFGSLFVIGGAHLVLGMLFQLSSMGMVTNTTINHDCEWLPNGTTTSGSTTSITWHDSCSDYPVPSGYENLFVAFSYLIYIEAFVIVVGGFFYGAYQLWRRI